MKASYNMFKGVLVHFDCSEVDDSIVFFRTMAAGFMKYKDTYALGEKFEEIANYIEKQHKLCGHG